MNGLVGGLGPGPSATPINPALIAGSTYCRCRYRSIAAGAVQQVRRRSAANAGSVTLRADGGGSTQTCFIFCYKCGRLHTCSKQRFQCKFRVWSVDFKKIVK